MHYGATAPKGSIPISARAPILMKTIAILFHENETTDSVQGYAITRIADFWREDGHKVFCLFGTSEFIPADLVLVHVNLSVVPESYLEFARRYPIVVNGEVRDIRKSTFSRNLLQRGDSWEGKVIVKSDLNYGGAPEERLAVPPSRQRSFSYRLRGRFRRMRFLWFADATSYRIYAHLNQTPARFFEMPTIIVEKFLPEIDGGMVCLRNYCFLGDAAYAIRLKTDRSIVKGSNCNLCEIVEPHPEIVAAREKWKFGYGKFDYVVVNGEAILLDMNKTLGMATEQKALGYTPELSALRRHRANGLYSYFR